MFCLQRPSPSLFILIQIKFTSSYKYYYAYINITCRRRSRGHENLEMEESTITTGAQAHLEENAREKNKIQKVLIIKFITIRFINAVRSCKTYYIMYIIIYRLTAAAYENNYIFNRFRFKRVREN